MKSLPFQSAEALWLATKTQNESTNSSTSGTSPPC